MKKVVTVTLGSSKKDFEFKTKFLGQEFSVRRFGADKDSSKAWELMRRQQANADAIALSDMPDHYHVGLRTLINKKSQHLMQVVTRVPVTTGASLRRLLQVRAVRHVQKELGNYFNNNLVLFLSGMRNYDMAVALSDYTKNLSFADPVFHAASPVLLGSLDQLELFAKGKELLPDGVPGDFLKSVLGTLKNKIVANAVAKSHVIVGTFREIQAVAAGGNLEGKTLITSAVDDEAFAFFAKHKVNLAVDVSPKLFDQVVGISTITAMILAATGKTEAELTDHDFEEILHELDIKPRLLHPTGRFRNIRRFAFVVHPLSQEYIKKGFPLPKGTPKFIMDKVETLAAYMPPMVYCKMSNIVSPSGAEAEGWLISVGGTPKEMLSHSPEFTYRRLLHAAKIAEGLGAQIMGLGAFTKVVGDAGVTVARRASIPITTGNSYSASGALWAAADAMRRMGDDQGNQGFEAGTRKDHGDRCHGFHRLGQRPPARHGLRRSRDRRARHQEAQRTARFDTAGHARCQSHFVDGLRQPAGRHGHDRHLDLGGRQEDPGHYQGQAGLRDYRRRASARPAPLRGRQAPGCAGDRIG
jgi:hypothetical protein